MSKICIDDDLKNVVGGLHTPVNDDQINENESLKENDKIVSDEKNHEIITKISKKPFSGNTEEIG